MTEAELLISSAIAELRRAEGLFRGALTETKKALLLRRLSVARDQLAKGYVALLIQRSEPEPLLHREAGNGEQGRKEQGALPGQHQEPRLRLVP